MRLFIATPKKDQPKIRVLSLFDGLSGSYIALERAGYTVDSYISSEIDPYCIQVSESNYPDIKRVGDITNWESWDVDYSKIDLVIGGFPCQSWSVSGRGLGDKDPRGMLFWTMLDVMKTVMKANPKAHYLMENVKMKREFEQYITHHTEKALPNVNKYLINASLFSAQNRQRNYWTNIEADISQIKDKGIVLKDKLEPCPESFYNAGKKLLKNYKGGDQLNPNYKSQANTIHDVNKKAPTICAGTHGYALGYVDRDKSYCLDANYFKGGNLKMYFEKHRRQLVFSNDGLCHVGDADLNGHDLLKRVYHPEGKAPTINTMGGGNREPKVITSETTYRKLTPKECSRLQTIPDSYCDGVSNTQKYKMLGNSFCVSVVAWLFENLKNQEEK